MSWAQTTFPHFSVWNSNSNLDSLTAWLTVRCLSRTASCRIRDLIASTPKEIPCNAFQLYDKRCFSNFCTSFGSIWGADISRVGSIFTPYLWLNHLIIGDQLFFCNSSNSGGSSVKNNTVSVAKKLKMESTSILLSALPGLSMLVLQRPVICIWFRKISSPWLNHSFATMWAKASLLT